MRITPLCLSFIVLAGSTATAQPAATVMVQLSNFKFAPSSIVLDHGRSYVLRLMNVSDSGHDFVAESFFDAASVAPADRKAITEGGIEVPPGQAVEIHLTAPAAGTYKLKCSHAFHKMFGMSGSIVVR